MDKNENDASRASVESFVLRPKYRLECPKYGNLVMEAIEEEKAERTKLHLEVASMKITIPKHVIEVTFSQFVGGRIRKRRNELGITAETLADYAGLSKSFLSDVENGKRSMSFGNMAKIAKQLGRSLDWFVKGWED